MQRVKLVVSDFHIGTGRRNPDGSLNLMEDFVFDERFVEFVDYYSTGDFTNAEVELIINGDFFNMLQVEVDGEVPSNVSEAIAVRQLQRILDGHPKLFDAVQAFGELPNKSLTFTVGNHDAGLAWPAAKQLLRRRLGEKINITNRAYVFDGVHIEHGDRYEPVHAVNPKLPYLSKGLPEPILNLSWGSYFFIHFVRRRKRQRNYIDKVKPFRNYLTWGAIFDFGFFVPTMIKLVLFVFKTALFGRIGIRRFGLRSLLVLLRQIEAAPLQRAARRILRRGRVHTVIFSHTHNALYRQWMPGREYFNTGCWNGLTNLDIEGFGFQERLTYAYMEWEEKRWLTRLRMWKGSIRPYEEYWG